MVKNRRRLLINIIWVTPVITSVCLPAHAETSNQICSVTDVSGPWEITNSDGTISPLSLMENGDIGEGGTWELNGNTVSVAFSGGDSGLEGTLNGSCNSMIGTVTSIIPDLNGASFTAHAQTSRIDDGGLDPEED